MNKLLLIPFVVALVPHIVDKQGRHFRSSQLPNEAAAAFATGCEENDPIPGDIDGRTCVTFLAEMAAMESGFDLHALGDCKLANIEHPGVCDEAHQPRARGPFQEHTGTIDERTGSWLKATRHYLRTVRNVSMVACPEQPIAALAGERCGDSPTHRWRWTHIQRVMAEVEWNPDATTQASPP